MVNRLRPETTEAPPDPSVRPELSAIRQDDGHRVLGWLGLLMLPHPERPQIVIRLGAEGCWLAEQGALCQQVTDGMNLDLTGEIWRLSLPAFATEDEPSTESPTRWGLRFQVDTDESRISLSLTSVESVVDLGIQSHFWPIYALARDRIRARRRGIPSLDAGWMRPEDLANNLEITTNNLFAKLWRLREQLVDRGVPAADQVLQHRRDGRIRVGTDQLVIEKII